MIQRRRFLSFSGAAAATAMFAPASLALAKAETDKRFVLVILRGAMDGLHALAPYTDPHYKKLRPKLALGKPGTKDGVIDLDGQFGLHPKLKPLHEFYTQKDLLLIPAVSTRYRERSHFDGQNMLENGSAAPFGAKTGWLNRALSQMGQTKGLAVGTITPLVMRGDVDVMSWAESRLPEPGEDFLARLSKMYGDDDVFAKAFQEAQSARELIGDDAMNMSGGSRRSQEFQNAAEAAAKLLVSPDGPRIAVLESQGWDTHFGQTRRLNGQFEDLAGAMTRLKTGLAPVWDNTVVMVVSEFGRTAAENGSGGTDHGTGGLSMLLGGAVKGGRVIGEWPGLSKSSLFEGRDVQPTTDCESIFKTALISHLGLSDSFIEDQVFPDSRTSAPMSGVFV